MSTPARPRAVVTGGSRGIGKAIAVDLGRTHEVYVGGRSHASVEPVVTALERAQPFVADVRDDDELAAACAGIDELDVLVHSAAISVEKPLEEFSRQEWHEQFDINVFGPAQLTRLLLPALRRRRGTIVFINSGSGLFSYPEGSVYNGTKFALRTMADCLREELRTDEVRVVSIHPGFVDTDMGREVRAQKGITYDPRYYVQPQTIASAVRLAVDAPPEAQFEMVSVRPSHLQPPPATHPVKGI